VNYQGDSAHKAGETDEDERSDRGNAEKSHIAGPTTGCGEMSLVGKDPYH
jgi:hypothetical protein